MFSDCRELCLCTFSNRPRMQKMQKTMVLQAKNAEKYGNANTVMFFYSFSASFYSNQHFLHCHHSGTIPPAAPIRHTGNVLARPRMQKILKTSVFQAKNAEKYGNARTVMFFIAFLHFFVEKTNIFCIFNILGASHQLL